MEGLSLTGMPRHFSRRMGSRGSRPILTTYKHIIQLAPASVSAGLRVNTLVTGVDAFSGQTSVTDSATETGRIIEKLDIQLTIANLVNIALNVWVSVQHLRSGQSTIDPRATGGSPQRNQVHLQLLRMVGQSQNQTFHIKFRIPKKFQRVREGDLWVLGVNADQTATHALQCIYVDKK